MISVYFWFNNIVPLFYRAWILRLNLVRGFPMFFSRCSFGSSDILQQRLFFWENAFPNYPVVMFLPFCFDLATYLHNFKWKSSSIRIEQSELSRHLLVFLEVMYSVLTWKLLMWKYFTVAVGLWSFYLTSWSYWLLGWYFISDFLVALDA